MEPSSLPTILTSDLINSIREHPILAPHTWYIIAATILTVLNRPAEVSRIYEHAITFGSGSTVSGTEHEEQLTILRRMREALIKTSAVVGVPKVCVALLLDRYYMLTGTDYKFTTSTEENHSIGDARPTFRGVANPTQS